MIASASKDETVIIWNMEKIVSNLNNTKGVDQQDFIISMIDDHEHVIDCIKFAPEQSCKIIQQADYSRMIGDPNDTTEKNMNDVTEDQTRNDDSEMIEESKREDDNDTSQIDQNKRMTTKEKVAKLKQDLKNRQAMLRGEITAQTEEQEDVKQDLDNSIQIDTSAQEK